MNANVIQQQQHEQYPQYQQQQQQPYQQQYHHQPLQKQQQHQPLWSNETEVLGAVSLRNEHKTNFASDKKSIVKEVKLGNLILKSLLHMSFLLTRKLWMQQLLFESNVGTHFLN